MLNSALKSHTWLLLLIACIALWAFQVQRPLNPDVAWLLDAGTRWFGGQRLYVDIIEINPPLVFYDMAILTAGTWSKAGYLAGVCAAIYASSLWCERKWLAFAALSVPALLPFGQRDHLALIAVLPYLVNERRTWPMGVWLFAGAALKPHLLLIPLCGALWRRQWDPALTALVGLLVAYSLFIVVAHAAYLTDIVPLARATYGAFEAFPSINQWFQIALILLIAGMNWRSPVAGAILGALLSYFLQSKFWYYQLIPAVGLAIYLGVAGVRPNRIGIAGAIGLSILSAAYAIRAVRPLDPIPPGAKRVLFLTAHIPVSYPVLFERGVENTSPYPAFWPVPGALNNPKILDDVRRKQVDAIVERCPEYIFSNLRESFDYFAFLSADPRFRGWRYVGDFHSFKIYRNPECG